MIRLARSCNGTATIGSGQTQGRRSALAVDLMPRRGRKRAHESALDVRQSAALMADALLDHADRALGCFARRNRRFHGIAQLERRSNRVERGDGFRTHFARGFEHIQILRFGGGNRDPCSLFDGQATFPVDFPYITK